MKKKRLGSFPFYGLVLSMTLALFLVGLFGIMVSIARRVATHVKENLEVQVFLDKKITTRVLLNTRKTLEGMDFISKEGGQAAISFVSREQAAKKFVSETGEDFAQYIGENPFRDVFVVKIDAAYHTPEHFEIIARKMERIEGVFEVVYVEKVVEKINHNFTRIGWALIGAAALLFLAALLIINNALRLAMFSQRFLIRSMQLVGATARFIKSPFLLRGALYGCMAAAMACVALHFLLVFGGEYLPELEKLDIFPLAYWMYIFVFAVGIATSVFSTYFAINRYLRMSLDQLY